MNSDLKNLSQLEKQLTVQIPYPTVQEAFEKAYRSVQKKATIKGFRKGKAPLSTIKALYKEQVTPDVLNSLVDENYRKALREHSLTPIDFPQIDIDNFNEQGLKFTAKLEVRPQVKVGNYTGLKVQKEKLNVNELRIAEVLESIRQSHSRHEVVLEDRPVQNDDIAIIDFNGFVDGQPLQGGAGTDHPLEVGANRFIPGFEEGVLGMKPGQERELPLKFPADYHVKEIAGKDVLFKVKLKELKKKALPELTDDFAKGLGENQTLNELREAIRKDISEGDERRIKDELKNRLLKELVKQNPVEVPPSMLKGQKEALIQDLQQKMQQQGLSEQEFEEYKTRWDQDFNDTAATMIQSSFLVHALAEEHKLHCTDGDFNAKLNEYTQQTGIELARLRDFYGKAEQRQRIEFQITEEKVVAFLLDKTQVEEVSADQIAKSNN